mmetsp:Transcript_8109/g.11677  ORF Transcript_8109/g.11677 Transcript_8109/m.11677 type:complete len:514 (-) Transcript_8109:207-1748(-)
MENDLPEQDPAAVNNNESDDEIDVYETPLFLDQSEVEEVQVDDDDMPMSDDEDDGNAAGGRGPTAQESTANMTTDSQPQNDQIVDMSKVKIESHTGQVYAVACSYDTSNQTLSIVSGGGDDRAYLHKVQASSSTTPTTESKLLEYAHKDSVSCVAFNTPYVSQDLTKTPKLVAVGAYDGAIVLYDPDTGNKVKELEGPSDVEWLEFHPKGGSVLLAGSVADGTIWMYHLPTSKCLQVFVGHESGVTAGTFTPDGRWALSASSDGTLRVWAPRTGMNKHVFRFTDNKSSGYSDEPVPGLTSIGVGGGSDGQLIICGSEDGMAHVCHYGTKKVVANLRHFEPPAEGMEQQDDDEEMELPMSVEAVGFASSAVNPNWCATGGVDGTLKIWDLNNDGQCRQVCRVPVPQEEGEAQGGDTAASPSSVGGITRLQWHPTLPLVLTSMSDGSVRLWDARNGSLVQTVTGHSDMINDLSVEFVTPEQNGGTAIVVSGSDDKTVRLYEIDIAAALVASGPCA